MKRMKYYCLCILIALVGQARGDGSFYLRDIQPLLQQQPVIWNHLQTTLEIAPVGIAPRISGAQNRELNGVRTAPYRLLAKPKGASGKYVLELVIEADTKFLDGSGRDVPLAQAVDYKELLRYITLRQVPPSD